MLLRQVLRDCFSRRGGDAEAVKTRDAYRRLFASDDGQRVLLDLVNRYQVFTTRELSAFDQGARSVIMNVLGVLENPELLKSKETRPKE